MWPENSSTFGPQIPFRQQTCPVFYPAKTAFLCRRHSEAVDEDALVLVEIF